MYSTQCIVYNIQFIYYSLYIFKTQKPKFLLLTHLLGFCALSEKLLDLCLKHNDLLNLQIYLVLILLPTCTRDHPNGPRIEHHTISLYRSIFGSHGTNLLQANPIQLRAQQEINKQLLLDNVVLKKVQSKVPMEQVLLF